MDSQLALDAPRKVWSWLVPVRAHLRLWKGRMQRFWSRLRVAPIQQKPSEVARAARKLGGIVTRKLRWHKAHDLWPSPSPAVSREQLVEVYKHLLQMFLDSGNRMQVGTRTETPLVSVILVLHNRAELTYQCLQS